MPCDSRVVGTKMTDADQLTKALTDDGWTMIGSSATSISARHPEHGGINFYRGREGQPFSTNFTGDLTRIARKYAEVGVRKWAKTKGFAVTSFDGQKMKLVNRRG